MAQARAVSRGIGALGAVSVWLATSMGATAQDARPVVVVVDAVAAARVPDGARQAISQELGAPVVSLGDPSARQARGVMTVSVSAAGELVMSYRDAEGRELWRTLSVPNEPVAAAATLAFVAGNLARNEAREIVAGLPSEAHASVMTLAPESEAGAAPEVVFVERAPAAPAPSAEASPARVDATPPELAGAMADPWGLTVLAGAITSSWEPAPLVTLHATHRFGGFALGLQFQHEASQALLLADDAFPVVLAQRTQLSLLATGELRGEVGPFIGEVGVALGLRAYEFSAPVAYSELGAALKVFTTWSLPLGGAFELLARLEAGTDFDARDAGGTVQADLPLRAAGSIGARVHL